MADIDVVPKGRSRTWVWLLLALVIVALLIWAMMGQADTARVSALTGALDAARTSSPLLL